MYNHPFNIKVEIVITALYFPGCINNVKIN